MVFINIHKTAQMLFLPGLIKILNKANILSLQFKINLYTKYAKLDSFFVSTRWYTLCVCLYDTSVSRLFTTPIQSVIRLALFSQIGFLQGIDAWHYSWNVCV